MALAGDRQRREQLARLARVRLRDVPQLVLLEDDDALSEDPRRAAQGSEAWLRSRAGKLTAGRFAAALGMKGQWQQQLVLQRLTDALGANGDQSASLDNLDDAHEIGGAWGHLHERSALATYLTAFLLPRIPSACLHETGYWPLEVDAAHASPILGSDGGRRAIEFGASPDALLEGADEYYPGGVCLEVKCPFRSGSPAAQSVVRPNQVPQVQGALLATGRRTCHLVSWSPTGCTVFELQSDAAYQQALVEFLVAFVSCASEQRSLGDTELGYADHVKQHSKRIAKAAHQVGHIRAAECVTLLPE